MTDQQPAIDDATAAHVRACRAKIAEHGYMIAAIDADSETGAPRYAYTIGLSARCGFEFAISGLEVEDMHNALAKLADRARRRKLAPVDRLFVEGVLEDGYMMRLRKVHAEWEFPWIARVLDLEAQPPVWQAQFPSPKHLFPGEDGFDPSPYTQVDYSIPPRNGSDGTLEDASC